MTIANKVRANAGTDTKTVHDIAAAAVASAEARILATHRAAVEEWRGLVTAIANGQEPDGLGLRRIAELAVVLKLPRGALAEHVDAVQHARRLEKIVDDAARTGEAAENGMEKLISQLRDAEQRLADLRAEVNRAQWDAMNGVLVQSRITEHRAAHPLLFADLDALEA